MYAAGQWVKLQIILTKHLMNQLTHFLVPCLRTLFQRIVFLFGAMAAPMLGWAQEPQTDLQRMVIQAGMFQIDAQIAQTPQQRQIGLMFRKEMPTHEGMLFIFDEPQKQCFWMKNTFLPLTAAFVDDDGVIVNTADMKPQSTESHCSDKPVRFVLEMNQGWFAKKKIGKGYKLKSAVFAPK
jgi:uncharacterized membrane protein (UPF0127 family)